VLKSRDVHVTCFIQTFQLISEQWEAVCCRREFTEECIIFFSSRVFYGAPCTSVFYLKVETAAVYLHMFTFINLTTVYASYLSCKKVFLTLDNYLHLKMASP